ncbi:alcohol dehydrogenase catalytic domain-containing protein [Marinobacter sp.]|uniref:alcohol dehydrogenase catalytic domain-containing protein n=1 Tax=Marinobacter sp. TaxID=50741 RepID=UPI003A956BCF
MSQTRAYAAHAADQLLAPFNFERCQPREDDVAIEILYCGVCHSDLHFARNDWGVTHFPIVPGPVINFPIRGVQS